MKKTYIVPKARKVVIDNQQILAGSEFGTDTTKDVTEQYSKRGNDSDINWFSDDEY